MTPTSAQQVTAQLKATYNLYRCTHHSVSPVPLHYSHEESIDDCINTTTTNNINNVNSSSGGVSNHCNWCLLAYSLLQHQLALSQLCRGKQGAGEGGASLLLPALLRLPPGVFSMLVESEVDAQLSALMCAQTPARRHTCQLLARNILKNWFFQWLDLDDLLTVTALVLFVAPVLVPVPVSPPLSPPQTTLKTREDPPSPVSVSSVAVTSGVRMCAVVVVALVQYVVEGANRASASACASASASAAMSVGGVLEFFQRLCAGRGGGKKVRLSDLRPYLTAAPVY